jgi:hypothetical protein
VAEDTPLRPFLSLGPSGLSLEWLEVDRSYLEARDAALAEEQVSALRRALSEVARG